MFQYIFFFNIIFVFSYYLPKPSTTWQWQLNNCDSNLDKSFDVEVYDIDLFDTSIEDIDDLHDSGIMVICYFSAGSYENWRDDESQFDENAIGNDFDGWEGEKFVDIRNENIRNIMENRIVLAKTKGCDGVEPDNVDSYTFGYSTVGFNLTYNDQINYNKFLASKAHENDLSVGLKNDVDQVTDLVDFFDFSVVEECNEYEECNGYCNFIVQDKAVFVCEYSGSVSSFCEEHNKRGFSTIKKDYDLNPLPYQSCIDLYWDDDITSYQCVHNITFNNAVSFYLVNYLLLLFLLIIKC